MKYIDAEKLFVEIERLKSVLTDPLCCQGNILGPDWVAGGNKMLNEISSAITSLQKEQPEVDLEKEMYNKATKECDIIWNEMDFQLCYDNLIEAFVAGAEWAMKRKEDKK